MSLRFMRKLKNVMAEQITEIYHSYSIELYQNKYEMFVETYLISPLINIKLFIVIKSVTFSIRTVDYKVATQNTWITSR